MPAGAVGRPCATPYKAGMLALVNLLVGALPGPARRHISAGHVGLLAQMLQFGTVGVAGFLVDTAAVYATLPALGLYGAGTFAYVVAVTTTWWLNRVWTFRGVGRPEPMHRQWLRFVLANLPGLCLNLGTYFILVAAVPLCARYPVVAVAAGAVAGMSANFLLSRRVVFR